MTSKSHYLSLRLVAATLAVIGQLFCPVNCFAETPAWAKESTMEKDGSRLRLVCSGSGSSIDLARKIAIKSCVGSAVDQTATTYHVSTTSIETEQSVGLHQQIVADHLVTGLKCNPIQESIAQEGGAFTVWLKCEFDLNKAKVISDQRSPKLPELPSSTSSLVIDGPEAVSATTPPAELGQYVLSDKRVLLISASPQCDTIMVKGKLARFVTCDHNPVAVTVGSEDESLIIRATGFKSKTLNLNSDRKRQPAAEESIEVLFSR